MCMVDAGGVLIILCYTLIAFILKKSSQHKLYEHQMSKEVKYYEKQSL